MSNSTLHINTPTRARGDDMRASTVKQVSCCVAYRKRRHAAGVRSQEEREPKHGHPLALACILPGMSRPPQGRNVLHENKQHNGTTQDRKPHKNSLHSNMRSKPKQDVVLVALAMIWKHTQQRNATSVGTQARTIQLQSRQRRACPQASCHLVQA